MRVHQERQQCGSADDLGGRDEERIGAVYSRHDRVFAQRYDRSRKPVHVHDAEGKLCIRYLPHCCVHGRICYERTTIRTGYQDRLLGR